MDIPLFKKLLIQQHISQTEFENIERQHLEPISVYKDVTTLLYLGILLFTGGLGILVYKNIDSIGHMAIIITVAALCIICFTYCFKNSNGYSANKIESPNVLFDYVLLLGCLLLVTWIGYIQFQYNVFGKSWGLATFIPMVLLFLAAYYFDHVGVLSMAITNLAAWVGFTVAPLNIIRDNDLNDDRLIYTGLIIGAGLVAISYVSAYKKVKEHFAFTYKNFGVNVLFISLLAGLFHFEGLYPLWFVVLAAAVFVSFKYALKERSFYFLVITVLYAYIGFTYVAGNLLWLTGGGEGLLYASFLYFIASGIGLIRMFIHYNKIFKRDAHLQ